MARKRGGLAGFWDRQKKIIKPVATGLAGLIGTPALGAAVGAAMGGLDRPGKSGVGLDVGGALKGGVSGYGMGKVGQALPGIMSAGKSGIAGLFKGGKSGSGENLTQRPDGTWVNAFGQPRPAPIDAGGGPDELTPFGQVPIGASGGGPTDQMDFVPDQGMDFGSVLSMLPGIAPAGGGASGGGNWLGSALGKLGKLPGVSTAANFLTGNGGLNALGTAQGINAALLNKKALEYAKNAEGTAMGQWNQNAPLRESGRAGMLAPKPSVDTSFLPGIRRAGNPFANVGG